MTPSSFVSRQNVCLASTTSLHHPDDDDSFILIRALPLLFSSVVFVATRELNMRSAMIGIWSASSRGIGSHYSIV
jgi:hypothetical protein